MQLFFDIIIGILVLSTLVSYCCNFLTLERLGYYMGNIAIISFFVCMGGIIMDIGYLLYTTH